MKRKLLHSYVKSDEWYEQLWKKDVEEQISRLERKKIPIPIPGDKNFEKFKQALKKDLKREPTDEDVKKTFINLQQINAVTMPLAIRKTFESRKKEQIEEWKKVHKMKDEMIILAIPFKNITCDKCRSLMEYQWSDADWTDSKLLFYYSCPKECMNKLIADDRTIFVIENPDSCPICMGKRSLAIASDDTGKRYAVYECLMCKNKEIKVIFS